MGRQSDLYELRGEKASTKAYLLQDRLNEARAEAAALREKLADAQEREDEWVRLLDKASGRAADLREKLVDVLDLLYLSHSSRYRSKRRPGNVEDELKEWFAANPVPDKPIVALDAEPCGTCGGTKSVAWDQDDPVIGARVRMEAPCPDCTPAQQERTAQGDSSEPTNET